MRRLGPRMSSGSWTKQCYDPREDSGGALKWTPKIATDNCYTSHRCSFSSQHSGRQHLKYHRRESVNLCPRSNTLNFSQNAARIRTFPRGFPARIASNLLLNTYGNVSFYVDNSDQGFSSKDSKQSSSQYLWKCVILRG